MDSLNELTKDIIKFRNARKWKQFHNPKDLSLSVAIEVSELMELFQWKNNEEISKFVKKNKEVISDELGDILNYLIILSHDLKIDLVKACRSKLEKNEKRYSVKNSKGNSKKYTEFS